MKVSVNIVSYKRPKVLTLDYLPFATVWVAKKEEEEYRKNNPNAKIVTMPDEVQGNVARVRNWVLDHTLDDDVVAIIDDDMKAMYRWEEKKKHKIEKEKFVDFLEECSKVASEYGAKFWGVNINPDKQVYREYSPFSTLSFVGGPFQCFLKGNELRYDEGLPLKEDYDMTLQQINKYRCAFRFNMFFYDVKQAEQAGGCAMYRNYKTEMEQLLKLQKKWGSKIVKFDKNNRSHSTKKEKKKFDFNPVIKVPIKGV